MRIRSFMLAGVSLAVAATAALAADGAVYFRGTDSFGARQARDAAPVLAFAPVTGLLLGGTVTSEATTFAGSNDPIRITASGGEIQVCPASGQCGSWGASSMVADGDSIQARRAGPTVPGQTVSVAVDGLGLKATFDATAKSSAPSLGSFASKTVSPDVVAESALSTFTGWVSARLTVSAGEARVCSPQGSCGSWSASSDVHDGDQVQLRGTAGAFGTTKTVTASAGGATATFDVAARAKDTVPDAFAFGPAATGMEPGATASSTIVTLAGFDDASISIEDGSYSLNGGSWTTAAGTAKAGDKVQIRTTGGSFGETKTATLDVGGIKASFAATVRAKDTTPDPITFASKTNQSPGSTVVSEIVQLRNHDGVDIAIAGANSTYRICADATCSASPSFVSTGGTAARDTYIQLRQTAPAGGSTQVATLTYGSISTTWNVSSVNGNAKSIATMGVANTGLEAALTSALGNASDWIQCAGTGTASGVTCDNAKETLVLHRSTATGYEFGVYAKTAICTSDVTGWKNVSGFYFTTVPARTAYIIDNSNTPTSDGTITVSTREALPISNNLCGTNPSGYSPDSAGNGMSWFGKYVLTGGGQGQAVSSTMKAFKRT